MLRRKKKSKEEIEENAKERELMLAFFLSIWRERPHYSELSGEWLGNEPLTIFFHHILKSRKYEQAKYDKENIILLTFAEHQQAEPDKDRYPEITKRREQLKIKYGIK